jgi:hypothetical protein
VLFLKTGSKNRVDPVLSPLFIDALEKNGVKTGSVGFGGFLTLFFCKTGSTLFFLPRFSFDVAILNQV